jgi:hypothetical protein
VKIWIAFKYVESGSGDPPGLERSDEVVVGHHWQREQPRHQE